MLHVTSHTTALVTKSWVRRWVTYHDGRVMKLTTVNERFRTSLYRNVIFCYLSFSGFPSRCSAVDLAWMVRSLGTGDGNIQSVDCCVDRTYLQLLVVLVTWRQNWFIALPPREAGSARRCQIHKWSYRPRERVLFLNKGHAVQQRRMLLYRYKALMMLNAPTGAYLNLWTRSGPQPGEATGQFLPGKFSKNMVRF